MTLAGHSGCRSYGTHRSREPNRSETCINGTPSSAEHPDGLLANPPEKVPRPLRRCKKEGNGRRRRVGIKGAAPSATSRHADNARKYPFEHFCSGAPRI